MHFKKILVNLDNEGGGRQLQTFAVGIVTRLSGRSIHKLMLVDDT